jgi:transcriptional regulator with XRE-family HTH domain
VADAQGYGARVAQAILDRASQIGERLTYARVGADVAAAEGRGKPYTSAAVSEWIQERSEPTIRTFRALAKVLDKPVEWLMALDAPFVTRAEADTKTPAPREAGVIQYGAAPDPRPKRKRARGDGKRSA